MEARVDSHFKIGFLIPALHFCSKTLSIDRIFIFM
jgi:hypothetical protein